MDIYETLNRIISNKRYRLLAAWFTQEEREKVDENDLPLFDLLKNISSLCIKICDSRIEFHPTYKASDGRRTFSIQDLTDIDYEVLMSVDLQKMPIVLRALVADILWTQKKKYAASKIAAESYWELFELWYTDEKPFGTLDMIKRAVCISLETKQNALYSKICRWLDNYLMNEAAEADAFFSLRVMELFINNRKYDISRFLFVLDDIISKNNNNPSIFEQAYNLKTKCLIQLKKRTDATNNNLALAECYVVFAERTAQSDAIGSMRSVVFFKKAIDLYRNNGEPKQAETIHRRLVEIQKDIPKNMVPISMPIDIEGVIENSKVNMEGLTFEESILRMVQVVDFDKQETLKEEVLEEYRNDPLFHMAEKNTINSKGQTVLVLPPLNIEDPEQDQKLLELHMHQKALEKQHILGEVLIKTTLQIIRDNYQIDDSSVDFVLEENYLVPKSRKRIFKKGITMFLNGEYYEAIHILAPQTEYFFRNLAKEIGGLTVTLEKDGTSMEKVLSSIFTLPEMIDCYDNDILFTFKGLLNEQAGANIRNEVAHGIIEEEKCSSGACLYFGAAVIKLLCLSSKSCESILQESEKLKHFEKPNENAIKPIRE